MFYITYVSLIRTSSKIDFTKNLSKSKGFKTFTLQKSVVIIDANDTKNIKNTHPNAQYPCISAVIS